MAKSSVKNNKKTKISLSKKLIISLIGCGSLLGLTGVGVGIYFAVAPTQTTVNPPSLKIISISLSVANPSLELPAIDINDCSYQNDNDNITITKTHFSYKFNNAIVIPANSLVASFFDSFLNTNIKIPLNNKQYVVDSNGNLNINNLSIKYSLIKNADNSYELKGQPIASCE